MTASDARKSIQRILLVPADGVIGPRTRSAFNALSVAPGVSKWPPVSSSRNSRPSGVSGRVVRASSFADPADVRAFNRCKAQGKSDQECFKVGDNGIGKWWHLTAQDHTPMCALPREDWQEAGKTGGAKVSVTYLDQTIVGILGDTMPARKNIENGAGIDLNPAFAKALALTPPFLVEGVEWRWA